MPRGISAGGVDLQQLRDGLVAHRDQIQAEIDAIDTILNTVAGLNGQSSSRVISRKTAAEPVQTKTRMPRTVRTARTTKSQPRGTVLHYQPSLRPGTSLGKLLYMLHYGQRELGWTEFSLQELKDLSIQLRIQLWRKGNVEDYFRAGIYPVLTAAKMSGWLRTKAEQEIGGPYKYEILNLPELSEAQESEHAGE